ncbi:MAG: hypothetical protein EXR76_09140 [Myxococcales bacterium]|nr:hypothetical protein [Myxococcales bacterium]
MADDAEVELNPSLADEKPATPVLPAVFGLVGGLLGIAVFSLKTELTLIAERAFALDPLAELLPKALNELAFAFFCTATGAALLISLGHIVCATALPGDRGRGRASRSALPRPLVALSLLAGLCGLVAAPRLTAAFVGDAGVGYMLLAIPLIAVSLIVLTALPAAVLELILARAALRRREVDEPQRGRSPDDAPKEMRAALRARAAELAALSPKQPTPPSRP